MSTDTITTFLKKRWPYLLLIIQAVFLFITNYEPGAHLYGWDTTAPEHNLSLNLNRILTGVWQSYRGLGSVDGMAHTANIVHFLYVYLLSAILPIESIRYVIHILLHLIGGIGVYTLAHTLYKKSSEELNIQLAAFFAAVLYQWNFMIVQMFYLPLELFSFHFALLPWGLWISWKYLTQPSKKHLLILFLIHLLGISQAHVPSIFIAYSINVVLLATSLLYLKRTTLRRAFTLAVTMFGLNAFWGLGYIYSAIRTSSTITNSTINQLSTAEIILRNDTWNDLYSLMTFGGFNLDFVDWIAANNYAPILGAWQSYYQNLPIQLLAISLSLLSFAGVAIAIYSYKKNRQPTTPFLSGFLFFFAMMGTNIPLVGLIAKVFREYVPFFADIFRFTFTKFSFSYTLYLSIFVATTLLYISSYIKNAKLKIIFPTTLLLLFIGTSTYTAFSGNFFYPALRQQVPDAYFELISTAEQNNTQRTLLLPLPTLYGWTNNTWGHRGSGFLWQLIPGSIVDRAFDAWSRENEQLYHQFNYAIQTENLEYFEALLSYYDISHIVLDTSIFNPSEEENDLLLSKTQNIISRGDFEVIFTQEPLQLLKTTSKETELVEQPFHPQFSYYDSLISQGFNTIESNSASNKVLFASVFNTELEPELITEGNTLEIPLTVQDGNSIFVPGIQETNIINPLVTAQTDDAQKIISLSFKPLITIENENEVIPLYELPTIEVENKRNIEEPVLIFNDQLIQIDQEGFQQITDISPREVQYIALYDSEKLTEENGSVIIDSDPIDEVFIEANYWDVLKEDRTIELSTDENTFVIALPETKNLLPILGGNPVINCSASQVGEVTKDQNDAGITYTAVDKASACEGFYLPTSATDNTTILSLSGSNLNGRNLKVFVRDEKERNNRLEYLFQEDEFSKQFLLPPYKSPEASKSASNPYWLNFETRSFGNETSSNTITNTTAQILPIDLELLKKIGYQDIATLATPVCESQEQTTLLYSYFTKSGNNCFYSNSQSYDPGWLAFIAPQSQLGYLNPQTYNFLPHTRYNSWANAWEVPEGNNTVVIIFWPQLLTFVGYGLLITTFIFLFIQYRREKKLPSEEKKVTENIIGSKDEDQTKTKSAKRVGVVNELIENTLLAKQEKMPFKPNRVKTIPTFHKNKALQKVKKVNTLILDRLLGKQ